jgi:hypothetical protein
MVKRIWDDTTKEMIYDRTNPKYGISVANGAAAVITYTYEKSHQAAGDDLQVELEFGFYAPRILIYDAVSVAAGATNNSATKLYIEGAASVWLMASETGASGVTINVNPYESATAAAGAVIASPTISASVSAASIVETGLPYVSLSAINGDGVNAATVTASLIVTRR